MGIKEGLLHIKDPIFTVNLQTTPGNMLNYYLWIYCWFVKTSDSEGWVNHTPWWMHSSIIYLYRPPLTDLFIPFYSTPIPIPPFHRGLLLYWSVCFVWIWSHIVCNLSFFFIGALSLVPLMFLCVPLTQGVYLLALFYKMKESNLNCLTASRGY